MENEGSQSNDNSDQSNEQIEEQNNQEYQIGRWSDEEHQLLIEALKKYGTKWDKVQAHIQTRDKPNIRSHA